MHDLGGTFSLQVQPLGCCFMVCTPPDIPHAVQIPKKRDIDIGYSIRDAKYIPP